MKGSRNSEASAKLRTALDMYGLGESIMRQKLRRTHPDAPEAEIEAMLSAWLLDRPGAEHGDAPGKVRRPAE
jgi:hypothetical protein